MSIEPRTRWGTRAVELYTEPYAERYRAHDESLRPGRTITRLGEWLHDVCDRFTGPIDALDLGCGTGRYFHALSGVRRLVVLGLVERDREGSHRPAALCLHERYDGRRVDAPREECAERYVRNHSAADRRCVKP